MHNYKTYKTTLLPMFLLVTIITLVFGLLPRGSFKENWIESDRNYDATYFGEYGYAKGILTDFTGTPSNDYLTQLNLSLMMTEQTDSKFRVLVYIGGHCEDEPFMVGQWRTYLVVMQGCDFTNQLKRVRLSHNMQSHLGIMTKISITLDHSSAELHINDKLVSTKIGILYSIQNETTVPIFVGNTPDGQLGWIGSIAGLTIKQTAKAKDDTKVLRDYQFASFDNNTDIIIDSSAAAESLRIPWPGRFPEQNRLVREPLSSLWTNQRFDVLINLVGFIPLGFATASMVCFYLGLRKLPLLLATVLFATLVSLGIELSQVYIAGRRSNLHDLVLNSTGSIFGAALLYLLVSLRLVYYRRDTDVESSQKIP